MPCARPACGATVRRVVDMSEAKQTAPVSAAWRAGAARLTWLCWAALLLQQAVDAGVHQAPWFIWLLKLLPLSYISFSYCSILPPSSGLKAAAEAKWRNSHVTRLRCCFPTVP